MIPQLYNMNQLVLHIHFVLDKITYPGWEDIRNLVNVHSLYWIHEGEGTFRTNVPHRVKAGMLVYLKPGLELSMHSEQNDPLRMTMVLFDSAAVIYDAVWKKIEPIDKLELSFLNQYSPPQSEELGIMFREIQEEWNPGLAGGTAVSQAKLQILLHKLHQIEQPDWSLADSGSFAAFEQIKKQMENGFSDNLKIEQLAEAHNISASYLRKLFHKFTGMGPKEYYNRLRNRQACCYLRFTDYPVKEIAKLCGFFEEYHFSKMFKQMNGMSPSAYRSTQRQGT